MISARVTVAAVAVLAYWLAGCATSPPIQEMSDARQAIAAAEQARAGELAPQTLSEARRYLTQAEERIREGNYGIARSDAIRAKTRAIYALQASQAVFEEGTSP